MITIHPTAIVHPKAVIGDGTTVGAYSIVLPWFCANTTPENFWQEAAVFVMQPNGRWLELSATEKERQCLMQ